jgi:CRP-like cAMP-binding protein
VVVEEAYIVTSASVIALSSDNVFRFGAGSVLGLAEGLLNKPSGMTVVTTSTVQAKVIPFHKIDKVIAKLPSEVKAILETIIKCTFAIS